MNGPLVVSQPRPTAAARPSARVAERPRIDPAAAANPMQILGYLRHHWLTVLFCGMLLGAPLAYAAYSLLPSKYESYALIQVASSPSAIASQADPTRGKTDFVTYLKTTAQLIKSDFVLNAAMNDTKYNIGSLPTLADQKEPIKFLDEKLVVTYSDGNEVIRISLEGDRPEDLRKIVDAVKDAYYREVVEKEIKLKKDFLVEVEKAKTALEGLLRDKTQVPTNSIRLAGGAPTVAMDPSTVVPAAGIAIPGSPGLLGQAIVDSDAVKRAKFPILVSRVAQFQAELEQYPGAIRERQLDVETAKKLVEAHMSAPPGADVLAAAGRDPEVQYKQSEVKRLAADYEYIRKVVNAPDSDRVQRAKSAAEAADAVYASLLLDKARAIEAGRRQETGARLTQQLDAAERAVRTYQERERVTRKLLDDAREELAKTPPDIKATELKGPLIDPQKTDLLTHDEMYRRLTTQQIGLDFEIKSPPRVRKLQDASIPTQKDMKKQIAVTCVAGLMGFALIGFGAIGYEMRAKKVSSLSDLAAVGPLPVVGVIPWQPDGSTARDPIKRADVNEGIDKLRAYIAQSWLARGAVTVTVTSPLGDEGKSFAAFAIASSLAAAGYKTLLVDFDLRQATLHAFAGVPNDAGICELLRGETDPRGSAIVLTNGLSFIPAGIWTDEARQLAVGGRLETLLAKLKDPYDCVILHGHALLTAAESVEVARRSDVVLLCALYRETRLPLVKRAVDRVATMEIPYAGLVYLGATPNEALC